MEKQSYVIWGYAAFLLIGGLIGFIQAGSVASLVTAIIFASLLSVCAYAIRKKEHTMVYFVTLGVSIFCLLAFFAYRFLLTYRIMPSGLMTLLTALLLIYLGSTLRVRKDSYN